MISETASLAIKVESLEAELAARRLSGLENSGRKAESALGRLFNTAKPGQQVLRGVGQAATLAFGVASVAAAGAIADWKNYNVAITEVRSITGDTRAEFQKMRKDVLELSAAIGVDATVAARGLYQTISAGIPKENAIAFLGTASKLAIAGVTDVDTAVDGLTNTINAFKIPVGEAELVADALFKTVEQGKTTVEELSRNMSKASVPAAALGVEYKELLATIIGITKQGTPTAEAFTQVKNVFQALANPSTELASTYERLGVESGRQLIAQEGLSGALEKVRQAYLGNDAALIEALRSSEAFLGVLSVTGDNLAVVEQGLRDVEDSAGAMGDAYATNAATLGTALTSLRASAVGLVEEMEASFGIIAQFAQSLRDVSALISSLGGGKLSAATQGAIASGGAVGVQNIEARIAELRQIRKENEGKDIFEIKFGGNLKIDTEIKALEESLARINPAAKELASTASELALLDKELATGVITAKQHAQQRELVLGTYKEEVTVRKEQVEQETALQEQRKKELEDRSKMARQTADEMKARDKQLDKYAKRAQDLATTERDRLNLELEYVEAAVKGGKVSEEVGAKAVANLNEQIRLLELRQEKVSGKSSGGGGGASGGSDFALTSALSLPDIYDPFGGNSEFDRFADAEEKLQESYDKRRQIIVESTRLAEEEKLALLKQTEGEYFAVRQNFDQAHKDLIVNSTADIFGSLASIAKDAAGEQSDVYKALFAASKAFAVANSIIKIQQGVAEAASLPWPTNLAAIGSTIAATAQVVGTISSTNYSGAYERGGIIPAGRFGLVGEAGPEFVQGPATVTSARNTSDMLGRTGRGGSNVTVNITNLPGQTADVKERETPDGKMIDVMIKQVKREVASDIAKGGNGISQALEKNYGLGRGKR